MRWANSGMVVEIRPEDVDEEYAKYGNLKMMAFQEDLEKLCYEQAGKTQNAGAQRMRDFVEGRASVDLPRIVCSGIHPSRLDKWLPEQIGKRLQQGFRKFGSFARGFLTNEAILIGVESRTSSPVRIPRDRKRWCIYALMDFILVEREPVMPEVLSLRRWTEKNVRRQLRNC